MDDAERGVGRMKGDSFGTRLRALRMTKGLSQVELARLIHRHPTAIGPYERDEYAPPREVVDRIAELLDTTPEYLWFGRSPKRPTLAQGGRIGPGGLARPLDATALPLELRSDRLRAWLLEDGVHGARYRPGDLLLVAAEPLRPDQALGRDALVRLADGRDVLGRLLPGARPDLPLLCLSGGEVAVAVEALEARPVLGVLAPDAITSRPGRTGAGCDHQE
ncbi:helix-turn-helix transcriptional regulator [Geminicoccus flavidas]|uniref:helix-turn-helix transcriptional regulator n=1 Tax=Geminicoccus flavidas TaxID=2506407 RepID=UPI00135A0B3D|nr:helix-turn-helix transcriptional regulator [Geminicoccus flavidas]